MTPIRHTIDALLGPSNEEIDCDACFHLLDRYVDEVVAGADERHHPRMHAHLLGCPACREEFESLRLLVTPPDGADARLS